MPVSLNSYRARSAKALGNKNSLVVGRPFLALMKTVALSSHIAGTEKGRVESGRLCRNVFVFSFT